MPSRSKGRVANSLAGLGVLSLFTVPAVLFAPGCQGHQCESDGFHDYGLNAGEGDIVDPDGDVWETTPSDDPSHPWLAFTPYRTWVFHLPFNGRHIASVLTYISADPDPASPGKNYTIASGNQATIGPTSDENTLYITNNTCAPFYLRVVVTAYPSPTPSTGDLDAGSTADLDAGEGGD